MFFFLPPSGLRGFESPALGRLVRVLQLTQERYATMTLGMFTTFLCAAEGRTRLQGPVSVSEVAHRTGQKYPSVARQLDLLGDGSGGKPGLGLLNKHAGSGDGRARYVTLSERGAAFLQELDGLLSPDLFDLASTTALPGPRSPSARPGGRGRSRPGKAETVGSSPAAKRKRPRS